MSLCDELSIEVTPSTAGCRSCGGSPILTGPTEPTDTALIVGPEGGFSDSELHTATAHGAIAAGIGELVLRADTAPQAALTIVRHGWRWRAP